MKGYTINPHFCLDDGTPMGVNVQLYDLSKKDLYWGEEERFDSLEEAEEFVKDMKKVDGMIERINHIPTHPQAALETYLLNHETDITEGMNDFAVLRMVFLKHIGRQCGNKI